MNRITRVLVVSALAATTLSACADDGGHDMSSMTSSSSTPSATQSGTPATGTHHDADVAFATRMIPHHAQAVAMADLVPNRASSQQVKDLGVQIKAAQDPEIAQMSGWLQGWGEPVPAPTGMHHGDGMMSMDEMSRLESATGAAFDTMWLQLMVKHHEGAITMSRTELAEGSNADAKRLAQTIIDGQAREIATMTALLSGK